MFLIKWTEEADQQYKKLRESAEASLRSRRGKGKKKSTRAEGLFKQVHKTITLLTQNPRHPGLQTHEYRSLKHPYNPEEKVFEISTCKELHNRLISVDFPMNFPPN